LTSSYHHTSTDSAATFPSDTAYFRFPTSLKWLTSGLTIAWVGLMAFALILQLTDLKHASLTIIVLTVAMLGAGAVGLLQIFDRAGDTVAVNSDGLWYLHPGGDAIFIAWSDVGSVRALDFAQRLVVTDTAASKKIKLEYQLENFEKLRAFVLDRTSSMRLHAPALTIFHRNWVNRGFMLGSYAACSLTALLASRQGQRGDGLLFLGFAVLSFAGLTQEVASVEILNDAILIKYLGWRRTVPDDGISNIVIVDLHDRGNVHAAVIIKRLHGKPLKLFGFREGSVALHDALSSAWTSRGGQPPVVPKQAPDAAQPSPSLLTTFHGEKGSAFAPLVALGYLLAPGFIYWELRGFPGDLNRAASIVIFTIPCAAVGIYFLSTIPKRLTIFEDSFTIEYFYRRRVVPYSSIVNVEMTEFRNRAGIAVNVVKVERNRGTTLRLAGFKEDTSTLYASLRASWQRSKGERVVVAGAP
jgi:hypothetical protein